MESPPSTYREKRRERKRLYFTFLIMIPGLHFAVLDGEGGLSAKRADGTREDVAQGAGSGGQGVESADHAAERGHLETRTGGQGAGIGGQGAGIGGQGAERGGQGAVTEGYYEWFPHSL